MSSDSDDSSVEEPALPWIDRELSWLSFNARVLQEAADPRVPLFERFAFLSIFSSNLDEFFRVRVASLRTLLRLKKRKVKGLGIRPNRLLKEIHATVVRQQDEFGRLFREVLIPELGAEGIHFVADPGEHPEVAAVARRWFLDEVEPLLERIEVPDEGDPDRPFLADRTVYLAVELERPGPPELTDPPPYYVLLRIPSPPLPRFLPVELAEGGHGVVFVDDVIRMHLPELFPDCEIGGAWAVKLSRDADLGLEDEFGVELVEAIRRGLEKRPSGVPSRFLYDMHAPYALVTMLRDRLGLEEEDLVVGGRYHNLHDLRSLPRFDRDDLLWEPWPPHPHPRLEAAESILGAIRERDHLVHLPYQSFDYGVRFLREAAVDPHVTALRMTVYRVAPESAVLGAMVEAAERGKEVQVFFEVQARFDERSNLDWARRLEAAGAQVNYSIPGLKVHAKVALVERREGDRLRRYAWLGTGNFNEITSRFYTDFALFTAHEGIGEDLSRLFRHLAGELPEASYGHLWVAPHALRPMLLHRVEAEVEAARRGEPSGIDLKLNSLQDMEMAEALMRASVAGVPIRGIIRGICCLAPGVEGATETIDFRSIVDRYLEHSRIYRFHAGGRDEIWLSSADWMTRNLSRRIEVAFPILDPEIQQELREVFELQWSDTARARRIDIEGRNAYATGVTGAPPIRAQEAHYLRLAPGSGTPPPPTSPELDS